MNNSGKITVFLCLVMSSMLLVFFTVNKIIVDFSVKEKSIIAAKASISDIKAEYNTYIFEHYHILLFDKNCGGRGEAFLEEKLNLAMSKKLGANIDVEQTAVSSYTYIYENECMPLKEQIADYLKYAAFEYGIDKIVEKTGGKDGTLPDNIDNAFSKEDESEGSEKEAGIKEDDPREYTKTAGKIGIAYVIKPADMEISGAVIDAKYCISLQKFGILEDVYKTDTSFKSKSKMMQDMKSHESWGDMLLAAGEAPVYATNVFNCALDTSVNESSVLKYELEYLVCGKRSDADNFEATVDRILLLRMPVNYAYLVTDAAKMKRVTEISFALTAIFPIAEPVMKALISGCWAFIEAMADVKVLLRGEKLPFVKTHDNWITDIDNIGDSMSLGKGSEEGLSYQDYIMILLAINSDKTYYRMLDLMNVNANSVDERFDICNGVTEISVDYIVSHGGKQYFIKENGGY